MQKKLIELSIIIVEYKSGAYLKTLLKKLPKRNDWETIVVDNTINNRGYGGGCNEGLKRAKGEYVVFLNPDVEIEEDALAVLMAYLKKHQDVGIVGPKYINAEGNTEQCSTQHPTPLKAAIALTVINRILPNNYISKNYWLKDWKRETTRIVDVVSGAAMMVRRLEFLSLGGFDPGYFLYWEEFDVCKRYQHIGKKSAYVVEAVAHHPRGISMKHSDRSPYSEFVKSREHYMKKFFGVIPMALLEAWFALFEQWRVFVLAVWSMLLRVVDLSHISVIGDVGRDYLQAVALVHGKFVPLMGIPSSIPRFLQGPFNVWFSAISFSVGGINPISPVIGAAILTTTGSILLYFLLEKYYGKSPAFFASLFAATAQGAVLQSRMPFYLFAIPLFLTIFLWSLLRIDRKKISTICISLLCFWMLFQWELATMPFLLLFIFVLWRKKIRLMKITLSLLGATVIGLIPQILFDLTHRCSQLCGLVSWVGYRMFATTGFDGRHAVTIQSLQSVGIQSFSQISRLFGGSTVGLILLGSIILFSIYGFVTKTHTKLSTLAMLGLIVLFLGVVLHGTPSEAYFPPLLVLFPILIAWMLSMLSKKAATFGKALLLFLAIANSYVLLSHHFYAHPIEPQLTASRWIVQHAKSKQISVRSYDSPAYFDTYLDQYKFFIGMYGGVISDLGAMYVISQQDSIVLPSVNVLEKSFGYVRVVKSL